MFISIREMEPTESMYGRPCDNPECTNPQIICIQSKHNHLHVCDKCKEKGLTVILMAEMDENSVHFKPKTDSGKAAYN